MTPNLSLLDPAFVGVAGGVAGGDPIMWKELDRVTVGGGSTSTALNTGVFSTKPYIMMLCSLESADASSNPFIRVGNGTVDTGADYCYRRSEDGASDTTGVDKEFMLINTGSNLSVGESQFLIQYCNNDADRDKLFTTWNITSNSYGITAGDAPARMQYWEGWNSGVTEQFDVVEVYNGTYNEFSELVILGYDPNDTDSTGSFWEELDEVTSTSDDLQSNTFTSKKYLWIQAYMVATGGSISPRLSFNGEDSSGTCTFARSINYGTQASGVNQNEIAYDISSSEAIFCNMFVNNVTGTSKLATFNFVAQNTAGTSAPDPRPAQSFSGIGTWVNTSEQIENCNFRNAGTGDYATGTQMKIWGSN